jgi:hypothetical protein
LAHIKLADLTAEPTTVELFDGHTYTVKTITRSVQKDLEKVDQSMQGLGDDADSDKGVGVIIDGLAALLAPVNGSPAVKKLLTDKWKADELDLQQINALYEAVQETGVKRPT